MAKWYSNTVICVDDESSVLDSYRQILTPSEQDSDLADILALADERDGTTEQSDKLPDTGPLYNLLLADSGEDALRLVKEELAAGRTIAAGFFDMRMTGMDGYETIKEIRKLDDSIICAVVTAYTDRSVAQIRDLFSVDAQDELLYFKKPFSPEELEQSAINMVSAWNRKRKLEKNLIAIEKHKQGLSQILHAISILTKVPPHSLQHLVSGFLFQLLAFMEADNGFSFFWGDEEHQQISYGVGSFEDHEKLHEVVNQRPEFQEALTNNRCYVSGGQCFIPLVAEGKQLGAIYIESDFPVEDLIDRNLMELFKNHMNQLVLNSLFHNRVLVSEEEAVTDPLTGLYNRRFLMSKFQKNIFSTDNVSVLVVDLDDFKKVNDTLGHDAGDLVLRKVSNILRLAVRENDLVGREVTDIGKTSHYAVRIGGDEFCLVLLNADQQCAQAVSERLRNSIEQGKVVFKGSNISITASIGGCSGILAPNFQDQQEEDPLAEMINSADKALYEAKAQGKNRVVIDSC